MLTSIITGVLQQVPFPSLKMLYFLIGNLILFRFVASTYYTHLVLTPNCSNNAIRHTRDTLPPHTIFLFSNVGPQYHQSVS